MFDRRLTFMTDHTAMQFRNDIYSRQKPLKVEELDDCYEMLRRLLEWRPLRSYDAYMEPILDAIKQSDTSVMKPSDRENLEKLIEFNFPARFANDSKLYYQAIGTINEENESKECPMRYRKYETYAEYEEAVKPYAGGDHFCDLESRLSMLQHNLRTMISTSKFFDYALYYRKHTNKDIPLFNVANEEREMDADDFEWDYVMPVLVLISQFEKAKAPEEKIQKYIAVFEPLKKLVTFMHDFCVKV